MDRRAFLKATLVTAGSYIVGCGDDGGASGSGDAGGDGDLAGDGAVDSGRTLLPGDAYFPQSLASGDPRPDSLILWTRVEDPDAAERFRCWWHLALLEARA